MSETKPVTQLEQWAFGYADSKKSKHIDMGTWRLMAAYGQIEKAYIAGARQIIDKVIPESLVQPSAVSVKEMLDK